MRVSHACNDFIALGVHHARQRSQNLRAVTQHPAGRGFLGYHDIEALGLDELPELVCRLRTAPSLATDLSDLHDVAPSSLVHADDRGRRGRAFRFDSERQGALEFGADLAHFRIRMSEKDFDIGFVKPTSHEARPGHELQHWLSTVEPSAEQLDVAEAALAACLELELVS